MANGEAIRIKMLAEASDADITDNAVAVVSVEDSAAATGYTTKKSLLSRIKDYIIGKVSISSLGDGTVTGAIAQNADDILTTAEAIGATSISGIGDGTVTGAISSLNNDLAQSYTTINFATSYTLGAGGSVNITADMAGVSVPSGYLGVAILSYTTNNNTVVPRSMIANATGTSSLSVLHNFGTGSVTATFSGIILCMKVRN